MKSCVQWSSVTVGKISASSGLEPEASRSVGQHLTYFI